MRDAFPELDDPEFRARAIAEVLQDEARERGLAEQQLPRWFNAFGEEVDLDNIDREYALNIYTMVVQRNAERWWSCREDLLHDPLAQKLREVILDGREPTVQDRVRGKIYNQRCRLANLPFRAHA